MPSNSLNHLVSARQEFTRYCDTECFGGLEVLIARAKLLAEDPEKRILVLCYNRLLAHHLAVALAAHRHLTVTTFHRWAVRCGVDFSEGEEDGAFGERLLARLWATRACVAATTPY